MASWEVGKRTRQFHLNAWTAQRTVPSLPQNVWIGYDRFADHNYLIPGHLFDQWPVCGQLSKRVLNMTAAAYGPMEGLRFNLNS